MRRSITTFKALLLAFSIGCLSACQPPNEKFVGTWTNTWVGNGADVDFEITKDDGGLLVKDIIHSNGYVLRKYLAKVDGTHIVFQEPTVYGTLVLSADGQTLASVGTGSPIPDFKKVK